MKTIDQLLSEAWRSSPRGFRGASWDKARADARKRQIENGVEALLVHCGGWSPEDVTDDAVRDDATVRKALKGWLSTWRENGDGRAWGSL